MRLLLLCCFVISTNACYVFPSDVQDPCVGLKCPPGGRCVPSFDGKVAACRCPGPCASHGDSAGSRPVCGSDAASYSNMCELKRSSCAKNREITIRYQGKCDPCAEADCNWPQACVLNSNREPICLCTSNCTTEVAPVCGSDGKLYSNSCSLELEACRSQKDLHVVTSGVCLHMDKEINPCLNSPCRQQEDCSLDSNGNPVCSCPSPCDPVFRPVCGSDLRTYDNECELKRNACLSKRNIEIAYIDTCSRLSACSAFTCPGGGVCANRAGKGVCLCLDCPLFYEPVCGADGMTYHNLCLLKREGCLRGRKVVLAHLGPCRDSAADKEAMETFSSVSRAQKDEAGVTLPHEVQRRRKMKQGKEVELEKGKEYRYQFNGEYQLTVINPFTFNERSSIDVELCTVDPVKESYIVFGTQKDDLQGDFILLKLKDRHVEFQFDLGNGPVALTSVGELQTNKWQVISARRYRQDAILRIDDNEEAAGRTPGKLRSLDLGLDVFIGGLPPHLRLETGDGYGFVGCIRKLMVDGREIPLPFDEILGVEENLEKLCPCGDINNGTLSSSGARRSRRHHRGNRLWRRSKTHWL